MKIALDPSMHRQLPLPGIARLTAELGYDAVALSPCADFMRAEVQRDLDEYLFRA